MMLDTEIQDPAKLAVTSPAETPVEVSGIFHNNIICYYYYHFIIIILINKDAIELSRKLNALKKNFCTQRSLMINAFSRTTQLLSPKQQALLLLKLRIF